MRIFVQYHSPVNSGASAASALITERKDRTQWTADGRPGRTLTPTAPGNVEAACSTGSGDVSTPGMKYTLES